MEVSDKVYETNSLFKSLSFDEHADYWRFTFENGILVNAYTLWRLSENNQIKLVSSDHGKRFGHSGDKVDVLKEISFRLNRESLIQITIKSGTGDLVLVLTNNMQIEIIISSCMFESYDFLIENRKIHAVGSGEIVEF